MVEIFEIPFMDFFVLPLLMLLLYAISDWMVETAYGDTCADTGMAALYNEQRGRVLCFWPPHLVIIDEISKGP